MRTATRGNWESLSAARGKAMLLLEEGCLMEAEHILCGVVQTYEDTFGPEDVITLLAKADLGLAVWRLGRLSEAAALLHECTSKLENMPVVGTFDVSDVRNNLAGVLVDQGKLDEAEEVLREILEDQVRSLGNEDPET